jgi:hypothetical protein
MSEDHPIPVEWLTASAPETERLHEQEYDEPVVQPVAENVRESTMRGMKSLDGMKSRISIRNLSSFR